MPSRKRWSLGGISDEVRDIVREGAKREGKTHGEYFEKLIRNSRGGSIDIPYITHPSVRPLKDPERTRHRIEYLNQAYRGLLAINGGGCITMITLLQSLEQGQENLAKLIAVCVLVLAIGLLLAVMSALLRYHTSLEDQRQNPKWKNYQKAYYSCMYMSMSCFMTSILLIVVGYWYFLEYGGAFV